VTSSAEPNGKFQAGSVLVGVGGVLLAISPYFQWVSVIGLININLLQLLILAGYKGGLAYIVSAVGGIVALIAFADYYDGKSSRPLGLCAGIIVGLTGVPVTLHLIHVVNASQGAVSIGPGLVIAGLGEALLLIGGVAATKGSVAVRSTTSTLSDTRPCPWCAETIKRQAILCRFCGRDVEPSAPG
jgi:hypothetical protein